MALEIERKFLLTNDAWRSQVISTRLFRDGLLARMGESKIRVRHAGDQAWITVKGPRIGISRSEFEYEIPPEDAEEMLQSLCTGPLIQKLRHAVPHEGLTRMVDEHLGPLAGIIFAEVELSHPGQPVPLPPWVGMEVTHDDRFRKATLVQRCTEAMKANAQANRGRFRYPAGVAKTWPG